ncbi:MAG: UDP-2,3-diacylglucosamine diphosphatase [Rugosibacter sp.]|nr:UDP-2,3-diacylglucosamine diphosphatase [Rugosibacter sp.]
MRKTGTARFVSDLHLSAERPDLTARFAAFLADTAASKVTTLFILGDLFDAWIGDDDLAQPFNAEVCSLLRKLSDQGTQLFFMAGNRDFLIGDRFAQAAGLQRLDDMERVCEKVGAGETAILIMHGDTLCTDDTDYQAFRQQVRNPAWQSDFLARPLAERRAEAAALRQKSRAATKEKSQIIMDVNAEAVRQALIASGCRRLIHGHTHRPGCEHIALADGVAERWVLSDWDTHRGDALEVSTEGSIRRIDLAT